MSEITTAARRIARTHNACRGQGGFLVFDRDGNGGAWYSDGDRPTLTEQHVRVVVQFARCTYRRAQNLLDADV